MKKNLLCENKSNSIKKATEDVRTIYKLAQVHVYATFPKSIMKLLHKGSGRVKYCIREEIENNLSQPIIAPVQNVLSTSVLSGNIKITKQR